MKIKGHDIRIAENQPNEPWPRAIIVDGKRMEFAERWENTTSGQRIFYKAADDTRAYQGFGVLRKDLQRIIDLRAKVMATQDKVYNTDTYQYWINGSGELCRAKRSDLDTMAMYEEGAVEILD